MERIYGHTAGLIATVLVLIVALSSLFAVLLGYSRIPYAAAADGKFFKVFARLHPTKHFPHISLLTICSLAFVFSLLFRLSEVISAILAMRIIVQFIGQAIGLVMLRKRNGSNKLPSTGRNFAFSGLAVISLGIIAYFLAKKYKLFQQSEI